MNIDIRKLQKEDIETIVNAFKSSRWTEKPTHLFEDYLDNQREGSRIVYVAFDRDKFLGYVTLNLCSLYPPFKERKIPEISDLNVLPSYRGKGIGSLLIEYCENLASKTSKLIGIGFGLYSDYGSAQKLYIGRGGLTP